MLTKHFRTAPSKWFPIDIFNQEVNPLIVIDPTGLSTYYNKSIDKKIALENYNEWQILLFVWQGKMKTDVFEMTKDIIDMILESIPF